MPQTAIAAPRAENHGMLTPEPLAPAPVSGGDTPPAPAPPPTGVAVAGLGVFVGAGDPDAVVGVPVGVVTGVLVDSRRLVVVGVSKHSAGGFWESQGSGVDVNVAVGSGVSVGVVDWSPANACGVLPAFIEIASIANPTASAAIPKTMFFNVILLWSGIRVRSVSTDIRQRSAGGSMISGQLRASGRVAFR